MPGGKYAVFNGLPVVDVCKNVIIKGLSLNLGKQKGYGLNAKPPAWAEGFSFFLLFNYSGWKGTNVPTLFPFV